MRIIFVLDLKSSCENNSRHALASDSATFLRTALENNQTDNLIFS